MKTSVPQISNEIKQNFNQPAHLRKPPYIKWISHFDLCRSIMEGLLSPPETWVKSQTPPYLTPPPKKIRRAVRKVMPSLRSRSDKRIGRTNPLQRFLFLIFLKNEGTVYSSNFLKFILQRWVLLFLSLLGQASILREAVTG